MSLCLSNPLLSRVRQRSNISTALHDWPGILLARWLEHRRRHALRRLLDRDTKTLDDIGLRVDEIVWALRLPLDQNAVVRLHERAAERRRIEFSMRQRRKPVTGLQRW